MKQSLLADENGITQRGINFQFYCETRTGGSFVNIRGMDYAPADANFTVRQERQIACATQ